MTKATESSTRAIIEVANEWLLCMHEENVTPKQDMAFNAWLLESPVHVREFLRAETVWAAMEDIDVKHQIDVDMLISHQAENVLPLQATTIPSANKGSEHSLSRTWQRWSVAATVMLAISVSIFWYALHPQTLHYTTNLGEQRRVLLEDGSIIDMNTMTELTVRLSEDQRDIVLLNGEALFTVAKDADRPFVVAIDHATVRALGTQFNVYKQTGRVLVTVIEGRVAVGNGDTNLALVHSGVVDSVDESSIELVAGDQAGIAASGAIKRIEAIPERVVAWTDLRLIFDNERLSTVVAEFNRYNPRQLVIEDLKLRERRISAVFDADQPEALVRFLTQNIAIEVVEQSQFRLIIQLQ